MDGGYTSAAGFFTAQFDHSPVQTSMNDASLPQEGAASLNSAGFMAYVILLIMITLIGGVMNGLTVAALAMAHSIP